MKPSGILLSLFLMSGYLMNAQTGSSCATAINIPLDGVLRSFTTSSSTGGNLVCTSSGTTPITYFSITSDSIADDIMMNITGPGGMPVEVAFYGGTACNNGNLEEQSSICFYDGTGIWAPAESFVILPDKTYILRIKTAIAGTIVISGINHTPPNINCINATPIGPLLKPDNNSCHKPGTGVIPGELCAPSLQNTAFYYYTVELTGESWISFENTSCDNNYGSNGQANGYQFGIFTGNCSSLQNIACYVGTSANVQLNTGVLAAGTRVYVAINGVMGSNCTYSVRGINAMVLSASLKYFTAWKAPEGNILKWMSLQETDNSSYDVQRSADGVNFSTIGTVAGQINSGIEFKYQFNDFDAPDHCFYRLKENSITGKSSFSDVILVNRNGLSQLKISVINPVSGILHMNIYSPKEYATEVLVHNMNGQIIFRDQLNCSKGMNIYTRNISHLPSGRYNISVHTRDGNQVTRPFFKSGNN